MSNANFDFAYAGVAFTANFELEGVQAPIAPSLPVRIELVAELELELVGSADVGTATGSVFGRSPNEVAFHFDRGERLLRVAFHGEQTANRRSQLLLDWVLPYVMTDLGRLVLHATGSKIDDLAWGFSGMSGAGKSTLAVSLATQGFDLIADDTFVLGERRSVVSPTHQSARLRNDSMRKFVDADARPADEKAVLRADALPFAGSPLELGGIFVLQPPGPLGIEPATAADIPTLLEQTYVFPGAGVAAGLNEIASLVERGMVHRLTYQRDFSKLADVLQFILNFAHSNRDGSL